MCWLSKLMALRPATSTVTSPGLWQLLMELWAVGKGSRQCAVCTLGPD